MIAQLNNSSEVHKLHISQSTDLQTPVTVEVEESGMYQVAIFAIREGTGIVGSRSYVGYTAVSDIQLKPSCKFLQVLARIMQDQQELVRSCNI